MYAAYLPGSIFQNDYGLSARNYRGGLQAQTSQQSQPTTTSPTSIPSFNSFPNVGGIKTGITNAVDNFGASVFGTTPAGITYSAPIGPSMAGAPVVGGVGPSAAGAPMTSGAAAPGLSSIAGSALGGAGVGGITASLTGGNPVGGTIGGGLGGAAAAALGFTGPIGMIAGGLLGGAVGGLFGKKKPSDKTQAGGINIHTGKVNRGYAENESQTGKKYSEELASLRDATETGLAGFSQQLLSAGAKPKDDGKGEREIVLVLGSRDGLRYFARPTSREDDSPMHNFGQDYKAYSRALATEVLNRYDMDEGLRQQYLTAIEEGQFDNLADNAQAQQQQASQPRASTFLIQPREQRTTESFKDFVQRYRTQGAVEPRR